MAIDFFAFDEGLDMAEVFGTLNAHIKIIEDAFHVQITLRDEKLQISGDELDVQDTVSLLNALKAHLRGKNTLSDQTIHYYIATLKNGQAVSCDTPPNDTVCITAKGKPVKAKTHMQSTYVRTIGQNTVTFGIGPAGTGKTYLAVALAVSAIRSGKVTRIILTRPAVEAGEKLGFLPGDMQDKVDPYLKPLYDALFDMLGEEGFNRYVERGVIEVAPLAFMRGRTLDDAFIILDEAQNTTSQQMKMFLTRLGMGSKAVVTGDITQIDLPTIHQSGLIQATEILQGIKGIATVRFSKVDVVRHKIVMDIIDAYEKAQQKGVQSEK